MKSPRNTYLKRQSVVQKKSEVSDTHVDKQCLVNTPKMACKGFGRKVITTFPICKEKREKFRYEKSETKPNPEGLDFPDNFMAIVGWRRVHEK